MSEQISSERVYVGDGFIETIDELGNASYTFAESSGDLRSSVSRREYPNLPIQSSLSPEEIERQADEQVNLARAFSLNALKSDDPIPPECFINTIHHPDVKKRAIGLLFEAELPQYLTREFLTA